ncbi:MAG: helix-turn-helix domain-containing protein [Marinosulfonomonas sp.]|nr:helix-turn-helix domain-containing protein [Marinosulfonomonas sp.]
MTLDKKTQEIPRQRVVKSVARTLETLEFFDEVRRPVNVVEVSGQLGYPQSSTSALLKSMVTMGFLSYDSKGRTYFPTDRVPLIGSWMNPTLYGEGALLQLLDAISERSKQVVLLGARNGDDAQYIQVVNPNKAVPHHISLGTRRPLGTSGVGSALLSTMSSSEVQRMFHRINAYRSDGEPAVDVKTVLTSIAATREKGYFMSYDRVVQGSGLIAMLLPRECTDRPLVIGIGAPTDIIRSREKELATILREEIDRYFGNQATEGAAAPLLIDTARDRVAGPKLWAMTGS